VRDGCGRSSTHTRSDLPSGTVTFLFTDVESSTRLLHELGAEGYAEALAEHRRAIREACARHNSVEWAQMGANDELERVLATAEATERPPFSSAFWRSG